MNPDDIRNDMANLVQRMQSSVPHSPDEMVNFMIELAEAIGNLAAVVDGKES